MMITEKGFSEIRSSLTPYIGMYTSPMVYSPAAVLLCSRVDLTSDESIAMRM